MKRAMIIVAVMASAAFAGNLWFYPIWRNDIPGNRGSAEAELAYEFGKFQTGLHFTYEENRWDFQRDIGGQMYPFYASQLYNFAVLGKYLLLEKGVKVYGTAVVGMQYLPADISVSPDEYAELPDDVKSNGHKDYLFGVISPGITAEYDIPRTNIGLMIGSRLETALGKNYPGTNNSIFLTFAVKFKIF